ncbi:polyketide synthase [Xylariaceae sp. FL0804]|nr:polyketide synthase [Xylariaceae sp. FL0804]
MDEPIAVVGLDAWFPGDCETAEKFYDFLLAGRSAQTEVPGDRYNAEAIWHPDPNQNGATRVRHGHFLKGSVSAFDAPFFSITPKEASSIDPQQRGMLESVYRALENAGISLEKAAGSQTGVYVGCFSSDYRTIMEKDLLQDLKYGATGNVVSMLSNRVSWFYDLRGPSLTIDTACSSSLVAAHQACNSLKLRETSMAIVGGCNLILAPEFGLALDKAGVLGPDGRSKSFDASGNGYGRGEGFGVVVLKRLSDALRDGDTIRAVVRNSGANQDGRSPGITQPVRAAQAELIRRVYAGAGLDPALTRFFEAHGTGTAVGDPIEAGAIGDVFAQHRSREEPLHVGALKSNIGHLEGAAGVAAIIKGVLTLERGLIPANAWLERLNPKIEDSWHLAFPTKALVWPQAGLRRMSLNSFGVGGANAHMVMDDALHFLKQNHLVGKHRTTAIPRLEGDSVSLHADKETNGSQAPMSNGHVSNGTNGTAETNGHNGAYEEVPNPQLFVWSSFDQDGVARVCERLDEYLASQESSQARLGDPRFVRDLNYTLTCKRTAHAWRAFSIAESSRSLRDSLAVKPKATRAVSDPRLAFVFTGQGAQWATMGRELMSNATFRGSIYAADKYFGELGSTWSLMFELFKDKETSRVNEARLSQPLCTALQVALVDLLFSWNVYPHALAGHSSGEVAAAYAAGALSRESAWKIAYHRGRLCAKLALSSSQPKTGMVAVALDTEQTIGSIRRVDEAVPDGSLEVACFNSPESHTVSGDLEKVDALVELLQSEKVFARKLNVEMAYHSRHMKAIYEEYVESIGDLPAGSKPYEHQARFFSSTLGAFTSPSTLQSPGYWADNLVSPVRFDEAVTQMLGSAPKQVNGFKPGEVLPGPITDLLEIGPHSALQGPLRSIIEQAKKADSVRYQTVLKRHKSASATALEAAGALWTRGHPVDLEVANRPEKGEYAGTMLTDLPSYPFNHSKEYWFESRISRASRMPSFGRHELLGVPSPDWNPENAIWRNRISLSESPWLEDHRVSGDILYPGGGMLAMAIEASRQLSDKSRVLKGFKFEDVSFHRALRIPDDSDGVETHFYLRPHREAISATSSSWAEFQLYTFVGEAWAQNCRGLVQVEYEGELTSGGDGGDSHEPSLPAAAAEGMKSMPVKRAYAILREVGNDFGPLFQTLSEVRIGSAGPGPEPVAAAAALSAVSRVRNPVPDIAARMPHGYVQPHLAHPASLDGVFQAQLAPLLPAMRRNGQAAVPFRARSLWVAARPLGPAETYTVTTRSERRGPQKTEARFVAVCTETGEEMVRGAGFVLRSIPSGRPTQVASDSSAFRVEWKDDPDFADPTQCIAGAIEEKKQHPSTPVLAFEGLALEYMRQVLDSDLLSHTQKMPRHLQLLTSWMQHIVESPPIAPVNYDIRQLEQTPEGALIVAVGRALPQILRGELDPLEVFFNTKLAEDFYQKGFGIEECCAQMCSYLDVLVHKNPGMRFLEIGAGTGGATKFAMKTLSRPGGGQRYEQYDFTDISPAFFEEARSIFRDELGRMRFRVLDAERDPAAQGFEQQQYDVILAANVLHATKNIERTLRHVRGLLRPGGRLVLYEATSPRSLYFNLVFGTLPGWWLSEEPERSAGPLMTPEAWDAHLRAAGFAGGVDAVFKDYPDPADHLCSILVSSAPAAPQEEATTPDAGPSLIITHGSSPLQQAVAEGLSGTLEAKGPCQMVDLMTMHSASSTADTCLFLPELTLPFLRDMSEETFSAVKHVVANCKTLLWATRDGTTNPDYELVTGFARTIRNEKPDLNFIVVSFEDDADSGVIVEKCDQVLQKSHGSTENSFRVVNGRLQVARVVKETPICEHIRSQTTETDPVETALGDEPRPPLALGIQTMGQLDTLRFHHDDDGDTELGAHEVEFRTMACGVGARDLAAALGQTDEDPVFGLGAAGVVTRVGPGVGSTGTAFCAGDRVFGLVSTAGAARTFARARAGLLARLPDDVSWAEGAAAACAYTTAHAVLGGELGGSGSGSSVVIHAAAGAVGQAAVQLARAGGAEVFATASTAEQRAFLTSAACGLPEDHVFSSRDLTAFGPAGLRRLTRGARGVDVVVVPMDDVLAGGGGGDALLRASWECVAPFGRLVELPSSSSSARAVTLPSSRNNARYEQFDLLFLARHDPARAERCFQRAAQLALADGLCRKIPTTVFSFARAAEAFGQVQADYHIGSVVLEPRSDDVVPVVPSRKPRSRFDGGASYVVVGGLSGLGQSITRWMVARGARNLILLSRSGAVTDSARELVRELESICDNVATPACDVADRALLEQTIADCMKRMPAIKGCIQGSMELQDNDIEHMSLEQWRACLRPKVDASWNLHHVLGGGDGGGGDDGGLDFFVLLSSMMGVLGNRDQANYAAGSAFQDALARHRAARGLPAAALDLPPVEDVGLVAEKPELLDSMRAAGFETTTADEVCALLDYVCGGGSGGPGPAQVILRPGVPDELSARGIAPPAWMRDPLFSHLAQIRTGSSSSEAGEATAAKQDVKQAAALLAGAPSREAAEAVVLEALLLKLTRVLSVDLANLDAARPLHAYGVDSLVAVDVRSWLLKELGAEVSVFDMTGLPSIQRLAETATAKSKFLPAFVDS